MTPTRSALLFTILFVTLSPTLSGQERIVILDTYGPWRIHQTLAPPELHDADGNIRPLLLERSWVDHSTAGPPEGWSKPESDDGDWLRGPARLFARTPYLARFCLRGRFLIEDPGRVRDLQLSMAYHGGVVIYLNGREIARQDITGPNEPAAKPYEAEAFLNEDGALITYELLKRLRSDAPAAQAIRRQATDIRIPPEHLQRGVNVLAIDILRAPYPTVVDSQRPKPSHWDFGWNTCSLEAIQLTASSTTGLIPHAVRPEGLQLWNSDPLVSVYTSDFGCAAEPLRPISLVTPRNGTVSGTVVAGSRQAMHGVAATVSDLRGPGRISAEHITVRYALPWGSEDQVTPHGSDGPPPYARNDRLFGLLSPVAPDPVPVVTVSPVVPGSDQPTPVPGAVLPIWLTVSVPDDAPAGDYRGTVRIAVAGETAVDVPIELRVIDWSLPAPQDFTTWVEILQLPDTLALEYEVPLWSERHWELIDASFRQIARSGSSVVYLPLIAQTNMGHAESMVRWIREGDGFRHDWSIFDRYLDLAVKHLGNPDIVGAYVWDVYMLLASNIEGQRDARIAQTLASSGNLIESGPMVTLLDPGSGQTETLTLPRYEQPGSRELWRPVIAELHRRLEQRGLTASLSFGMISDTWPSRDEIAFFADLSANTPWVFHSHMGSGNKTFLDVGRTGYQIRVWNIKEPEDESQMGWSNRLFGHPLARYFRQGNFDRFPLAAYRTMLEFAIAGNQTGVGRLSADNWLVLRDNRGRRRGRVYARFPHSAWRNFDLFSSLLGPSPTEPAATPRYEQLLAGMQECEARIVIERALADPALRDQLPPTLIQQCETTLRKRQDILRLCFSTLNNRLGAHPAKLSSTGRPGIAAGNWFLSSDPDGRAANLFSLAGAVEKALGSRDRR